MPFQKDEQFIDRQDIFAQIEKQLHMHSRASLCGIGGVGYTSSSKRTIIYTNKVPENLRSQSSTLTGFGRIDRRVMFSGYLRPALLGLCRPTEILHRH